MYALILHMVLMFTWVAATGDFTESNLVVGFVLGYIIIVLTQQTLGTNSYAQRSWRAIKFITFFVWEMFIANVRVAYSIIVPSYSVHSAVVAIPLAATTDIEITLLANLISLTPGTLSLDISADRTVLYLHAMFVEDPDELRDEIKAGFERRLLELLR